jgi:uncharacterized membrane protein
VSGAAPAARGSDTEASSAAEVLEAAIGRLLVVGIWTAMALVLVGVVLMLATGVDPLAHGAIPPFNLAQIPADLLALQPEGFLWAGIVLVILLPIGRVVVAGLAFVAERDWRLALVSFLVLLVVLVSIAAAIGLEA